MKRSIERLSSFLSNCRNEFLLSLQAHQQSTLPQTTTHLYPELPVEIWPIVFQNLGRQDLVSCSRTCWAWNVCANSILYETVYLTKPAMLQRFIEIITDSQEYHKRCSQSTMNKHRQVGHLVKVVDLSKKYFEYVGMHNYATMLATLASMTPNVHSSGISVTVHRVQLDTVVSKFDWRTVATKWTRLTNLTLRSSDCDSDGDRDDLKSLSVVLDRLRHLDISRCECFLTLMLPSLPTLLHLQSIAVIICTPSDFQALKKLLKACQNTLQTLTICFSSLVPLLSINLNELTIGHKQLKAFELTTDDKVEIDVTSLGDDLEHLRWWSNKNRNGNTLDHSMSPAMVMTRKLKTLSFAGNIPVEHISLTLESNKSTLRTFHINCSVASDLIACLLENNVKLYNVTTLCLDCDVFENSDVCSLAEIFPNVEFLGLSRGSRQHEMSRRIRLGITLKWITTDVLSYFQHLKAIDHITSLEIIDESAVTYQRYNLRWPKFERPTDVQAGIQT